MTGVLISECAGLWRRTLLVEADGSRDTSAGVVWLQGLTAYVDSRGFAGTLSQSGNVFEWHRAVDTDEPGPQPDAGEMLWDGDVLVETGVYADYVEHWVRDDGAVGPCGALFLVGPSAEPGVLVRVGMRYGFAGGGAVVIADVGTPGWHAMDIDRRSVRVKGVHWSVRESEGDVNS